MDLRKSQATRLVILVLKLWLTGLVSRIGLGLCLDLAETCVIGLDISVSEMRGNHTDLAEPDLLKSSSKPVKVLEFPEI